MLRHIQVKMLPNSVPTWGRHSRRPTAGTSRQASCHRRALSCCGGSASQMQQGRHNVLWGKACTNLLELAGSLHLHIAGHHLVDTATHASKRTAGKRRLKLISSFMARTCCHQAASKPHGPARRSCHCDDGDWNSQRLAPAAQQSSSVVIRRVERIRKGTLATPGMLETEFRRARSRSSNQTSSCSSIYGRC